MSIDPSVKSSGTKDFRVHVENGMVHFATSRDATLRALHVEALGSCDFCREADRVFVYGMPQNAELITRLIDIRRKRLAHHRILIGHHGLTRRQLDVATPDQMLQNMGSVEYCSSTGGWHTATEYDRNVYTLVAAHHVGELASNAGRRLELLAAHPAWPALSFIGIPDDLQASLLLSTIVDPRWHYDPVTAKLTGKLKSYLGVGSDDPVSRMRRILDGEDRGITDALAAAVLRTWTGRGNLRELAASAEAEAIVPYMFLWRVALRGRPDGLHMGYLRATHVFLRFLTAVWIDRMTPHRELFIPEYFFVEPEVVAAWKAHVTSCEDKTTT